MKMGDAFPTGGTTGKRRSPAETIWLTVAEFAERADITPRSAARVLAAAHAGRTWQDASLRTRMVKTRGGAGGKRLEVDGSTLPFPYCLESLVQVAIDEPQDDRPLDGIKQFTARRERRTAVIRYRAELIADACAAAPNSRERHFAIGRAALKAKVSQATIYRWIERQRVHGLAGLATKKRYKPRPELIVSNTFDVTLRGRAPAGFDFRAFANEVDLAISFSWAEREARAGQGRASSASMRESRSPPSLPLEA